MGILISPEHQPGFDRIASPAEGAASAWRLVGWLGTALVIMGVGDVSLAWFPTAFGTVEWEFAVISATLNGLALPTVGAFLALCAALAMRRPVAARIVGAALLVLAAVMLALAVVYVTSAPIALAAVGQNPAVLMSLKKGIGKAAMLFVVYTCLLVAGGLYAWRSTRRRVR